jgi:hypothetical protein
VLGDPCLLDRLDRRETRYLIEAVTGGETLPVKVDEQILPSRRRTAHRKQQR